MSSKLSKKFSIAAVSAVMAGGTALLVVPAGAATVAPINYTCPVAGNNYNFQVTADTTLPDTAVAGSAITGTGTFTVVAGDDVRSLMYGFLGARQLKGDAAITATVSGAPVTLAATIPVTPVPAETGPVTIPATAPIALTAPATAGTYEIRAGNFTTNITLIKEDASQVGPIAVTCTLVAGQNTLVDTLTVTPAPVVPTPTPTPTPVVKSDTTTTAKAKFAKKKATVKVAVKAASGTATGKVTVTLKKGAKKVKTITANLSSGKAKATFKKITAKGKYKVVVKYAGSETTNASSAKTTFKV